MRTHTPLYRKVGGLHFVRLGRLQFSFCLCRPVTRQGNLPMAIQIGCVAAVANALDVPLN